MYVLTYLFYLHMTSMKSVHYNFISTVRSEKPEKQPNDNILQDVKISLKILLNICK